MSEFDSFCFLRLQQTRWRKRELESKDSRGIKTGWGGGGGGETTSREEGGKCVCVGGADGTITSRFCSETTSRLMRDDCCVALILLRGDSRTGQKRVGKTNVECEVKERGGSISGGPMKSRVGRERRGGNIPEGMNGRDKE